MISSLLLKSISETLMTALPLANGANTANGLGKKKHLINVLLVFFLRGAIYDPREKVRHKAIRNYWMIGLAQAKFVWQSKPVP